MDPSVRQSGPRSRRLRARLRARASARARILSMLLCASLLGAGATGPSVAPRAHRRPLPRHALVQVHGGGWGHRIGMGQWGALGMAEAGHPWRRIVRHYYRGVRIERMRTDPVVRVLVRRGRSVVLSSSAPFAVRTDSGRTLARVGRSRYTRLRVADGRIVVDRGSSFRGPWRAAARGGSRVVAAPGRGLLQVVQTNGGARFYRGRLVVARARGGLAVTDRVSLEAYLRGVVPREMPASWPPAALQAQAVAARTYAMRIRRNAIALGKNYDLCATTACQVYGGAARRPSAGAQLVRLEHPRATRAVRSTRGAIMTWRGGPILAQYSSSTGGHTRDGSAPYLRAVRDPWDRVSPRHRWTVRSGIGVIEHHWPALGRLVAVSVRRRDGDGPWGGRVRSVLLRGTRASLRVDGTAFRRALDLPSDLFRLRVVTPPPDRYAFRFDMGYGTRHTAVWHLQRRLARGGLYPRSAPFTTYFGPITRDSLVRYQRARGLPATGYLGPRTRARLNADR